MPIIIGIAPPNFNSLIIKNIVMKKILFLLIAFNIFIGIASAQKTEVIGKWQLTEVEVGDKKYENLKAVFVFDDGGLLKSSRSVAEKLIELGQWKYNKNRNSIIMSSNTGDKDFNGEATIVEASKNNLVYKKDDAVLYFNRLKHENLEPVDTPKTTTSTIARLDFTSEEFFTEDGDFKYEADVEKLPWQDPMEMMMTLVNVQHLVYKYSTLVENTEAFEDKTLTADINSNPQEQELSIDFIFYGYDRYNLPEDAALPPNTEYANLLYPEQENTFRIAATEQLTTPAGTFDCVVVEVLIDDEARKKLWMVKDKPAVYAKIIDDKAGRFGHYSIYELQEIK